MAVAEFISPVNGTYIRLDAVESYSLTLSGTPTQHPVESGKTLTDHYIINNQRLSYSGIISDIKLNGLDTAGQDPTTNKSTLSPEDFISELDKVIKSRQTFTVFLDSEFEQKRNCLITSADISRTQIEGKGFRVSFQVEQIQLSQRAKVTIIEVPNEDFQSAGSSTQDQGQQSTKTIMDSLVLQAGDSLVEAALGGFGGTTN